MDPSSSAVAVAMHATGTPIMIAIIAIRKAEGIRITGRELLWKNRVDFLASLRCLLLVGSRASSIDAVLSLLLCMPAVMIARMPGCPMNARP